MTVTQPGDELYCLLVPLGEDRLLVPRGCISEVINYQAPTPMEGAPAWYLGTIAWAGRRVPLMSFEAACGRVAPRASGRTRIVVMQAISSALECGHFAVLTQGFPQLVRVSPDVVHADESRNFGPRSPVICQLRMMNEYPLVPDFERIEAMFAEETRAA
jgi:chemosensory pili system protein ChpC